MKNKINAEFEKIMSIQSGAGLYLVFFRVNQIAGLLSLGYFLFVLSPFLLYQGGAAVMPGQYIALPVMIGVAQILITEFALRSVKKNKFIGTAIGIFLALLMLPSWWFCLGLFGLYAFLNESFQREQFANAPAGFLNLLTAMNLNKMKIEN